VAGVVQWTVDEFWGQLQNLKDQITQADSALNADKARLGALYATARQNYDPMRDILLAPLIHRNTELRLNYLKPVKDKFNEAVAAASSVLRSAGYTTPQLSGLGVLPLVPVIAVTAVLVALAAVAIVWRLTQAQITRTDSMAAIFNDPHTTPDQKLALSKQMTDQVAHEPKPPLGFDVGALLPLAAIVAVIVLGPQILRMLPQRRAA